MPIPTIHTNRITLRPFQLEDTDRIVDIMKDKNISAHMESIPFPYEPHHATGWIAKHESSFENQKELILAITLQSSNQLIGSIGIRIDRKFDRGEMGYWLARDHWSNGYVTEAACAILKYSFGQLGLNRIFARHNINNIGSRRVMQKVGMKSEGILRQHTKKDGLYVDEELHSILRHELRD